MNAERMGAFIWLAIGLGAVAGSVKLGLGTGREPGSGFLPFLASTFVSLMALIILLGTFRRREEKPRKISALWQGVQWKRSLAFFLVTGGYLLAFDGLGFALSTFLFLVVLLKGIEKMAWWKVLLISAISTGFAYFLLSVSLESTLPRGILGI